MTRATVTAARVARVAAPPASVATAPTSVATARAVPFYCPYCSDEDLRPFDPTDGSSGHGQWRCQSCQRVFGLKYLGLAGGWDRTEQEAVDPGGIDVAPNTADEVMS